jgi:hypothetical protein
MSSILHRGFLSSINIPTASIGVAFNPPVDLDIWYTTLAVNEEITFLLPANSVTIFAEAADLYIEICTPMDTALVSQIVYIKANEWFEFSLMDVESFRVLGAADNGSLEKHRSYLRGNYIFPYNFNIFIS